MAPAPELPPAPLRVFQPEGRRAVVLVERPRCPGCGSCNLQTDRSTREGEIITRLATCRTCGAKLMIVLE